MKHLTLFVVLLAGLAYSYQYGLTPADANKIDVLAQWESYKQHNITSLHCPNENTMLRILRDNGNSNGEFQGYGLVFAAFLEEDDELFEKL
jgi:hypothetical protein